jgi:hypothetical protein
MAKEVIAIMRAVIDQRVAQGRAEASILHSDA